MSDSKPLLIKWQLLRQAAEDDRLTAPADFRVLIAILDRMNSELVAWPGFGKVATDVGIARSTVIESIKRLVNFGYLIKDRDHDHNSNRYRLGSPESRTFGSPKVRTGVVRESGPAVVRTSGPEFISLKPPNETDSLKPPNRAERFGAFWTAYPRKEGKAKALKIWQRDKLDSQADQILADIQARLADPGQWKGKDKQYIPHGSTYLNNRRWEDEWKPSGSAARLPRDTPEDIEAANAEAERKLAQWNS